MQRKLTTRDHIYLFLPFIIMGLLYWSSSMTAETQSLQPMLETFIGGKPLEKFLASLQFQYGGKVISIQNLGYFSFIEFFIRKGAHFFSYFFLGFFWVLGLKKRVREEWLTTLLSILLCIGYASFDELRQSFNPGRTGLMVDVILDTAGAVTGVFIAWLLTKKKIIR